MLPRVVISQGKGLHRGWFDADDYADQTAIFVHGDKGFATNELATRWLVDYFDTWTRDAADGQQYLLILHGHRTHYGIDFVRYVVTNGITLLSYLGHATHLLQPLDIGLFALLQKAYGAALAKPKLALPRSSSLASIHRQSDKHTRRQISKQPGAPLAYTLSTQTLSYSHFFENWDRNKAMEDMPGARRPAPASPRSSWPGKRRRIAANYATSRMLQLTSPPSLAAAPAQGPTA